MGYNIYNEYNEKTNEKWNNYKVFKLMYKKCIITLSYMYN